MTRDGPDGAARPIWRRILASVRDGAAPDDGRSAPGALDSIAPSKKAAAETLRREISRLAGTGALDQGSANTFDVTVSSWVEQWHNDIDDAHDALMHELSLQEAHAAAEVARLREFENLAKQRLSEIDTEIEHLKKRARPAGTRAWRLPRRRGGRRTGDRW